MGRECVPVSAYQTASLEKDIRANRSLRKRNVRETDFGEGEYT